MNIFWEIDTDTIVVDEKADKVAISAIPELVGLTGHYYNGQGVAFFFGEGFDNYEFYLANTKTGVVRKLADKEGHVLIDYMDVDMETIREKCPNGADNAERHLLQYERMNRWDGFHSGICALSWVLYPDGQYFADEDGYGAEHCKEEIVYGIIDLELKIIRPFTYVKDIKAYLKKLRGSNLIKK